MLTFLLSNPITHVPFFFLMKIFPDKSGCEDDENDDAK